MITIRREIASRHRQTLTVLMPDLSFNHFSATDPLDDRPAKILG